MAKTRKTPASHSEKIQADIRDKLEETTKKYVADSPSKRFTMRPVEGGAPDDRLGEVGSEASKTPTLKDGVYETNVMLERTWSEILPEVTWRRGGDKKHKIFDIRPSSMPSRSEFHMRGIAEAPEDETRWEKFKRVMDPSNLDQVATMPLKLMVETRSGQTHIYSLTMPKDDKEFTQIMGAIMNAYKDQGIRRMVLSFPEIGENYHEIDLKRVELMLKMAEESVPPVAIRLDSNILKRLAMTPTNKAEAELMDRINKKTASLKEKVLKDPELHSLQAEKTKEILVKELEKNLQALQAAKDEVNRLRALPAPGASNDDLKKAIKKLDDEMKNVQETMDAIKLEGETRSKELSDDIAKQNPAAKKQYQDKHAKVMREYKTALDSAKTVLTDASLTSIVDRTAPNTLITHADADVKKAAEGLQADITAATKTNNDALTQVAPHDHKADLLLPQFQEKLRNYENALIAVEPPAVPTPDDYNTLRVAQEAVEDVMQQMKVEIDLLRQEGLTDIMRKYEDPISEAAWNKTDELQQRAAALNAPANATPQMVDAVQHAKDKADTIHDKAESLNDNMTNYLQVAPAQHTP